MTHLQQRRRRRDFQRSRTFLRSLRFESLEDRLPLATINLGLVDATISGADVDDESGISVSGAGDVNGDGFDDMIIGARYGDAANNARNAAGESYLIFGKANWSAAPAIDLANLGTAGVTLYGVDVFDYSGRAVNSAGDVNGDGFDDFLIGAVEADAANNLISQAGESYLIFGKPNWSNTPAIDLANLGSAGVTFFGADLNDYSGRAVSSAGDVNGDGFDDLLIGAHYGDGQSNARTGSGETVLIFGKANWSATPTIDLGNLGPTGTTIFGANPGDDSGLAVSSAGDVNGDGFDDLLIGARYADAAVNAKNAAGDSYIVFGKANWSATLTLDLANLGTAGVILFGADPNDYSGISVNAAGDVNGDGFDDILIGAVGGDWQNNTKENAGESYLVFGKADWSTSLTIDLATLGSAGVTFFGVDVRDNSGLEVNTAGDINGDGFDDLVIGAGYADAIGNAKTSAGETYVVFGRPSWSATFFLETLSDSGITIFGADPEDRSGFSVDKAGDIDGDGFDDLIIGASGGDAFNNAKLDAGDSYLIFGNNQFTQTVTHLGTEVSETLTGTSVADVMVGHRGNDVLVGSGGADVLRGGQGNDVLAVSSLAFQRIVGGNGTDTLRLDGSGIVLDLTTRPDNRTLGIELINLTGSGSNTLTLNVLEVLNISDESNTLVVLRDSNDTVNRGTGWTRQADEVIGGNTFEVYTQGAAILKVQAILVADVRITKTAAASTFLAGGSVVFTVQVTNTGPSTATGVTVSDPLPPGLTFDAAASSNSCSAVGTTVTCNLANISSGANISSQIGTRILPSVSHGAVITNTATVSANELDPTPGDRSATASITVNREADLFVTKTPSTDPVAAGSSFTYSVKIDNRGPSEASGVTITDTLASGLTFFPSASSPNCSANGQVVTCNVGTVAAGTNTSPRIGAVVAASLAAGTVISNTANVSNNETDPTPNDHSTTVSITVNQQANLQVTKTASQNPVFAGSSFHYTVEVANAGPSNASGVLVTDTLPVGLSFNAANSSGACAVGGQDVTCTIGDLAPNATRTLTIAVDVASSLTAGTVLSNTATVSGNEPDPNPNDQRSTVTVTVSQASFPWRNESNPLDVNNDGFVSPIDVLQIINELNLPRFSGPGGRLPTPPPPGTRPFLDVNGDNFVVPNDALTVINFLNTHPNGEGESAPPEQLFLVHKSLSSSPLDPELARIARSVSPTVRAPIRTLSRSPMLAQNDNGPTGRDVELAPDERRLRSLSAARSQVPADRDLEEAIDAIASDVDAMWRTTGLPDTLQS